MSAMLRAITVGVVRVGGWRVLCSWGLIIQGARARIGALCSALRAWGPIGHSHCRVAQLCKGTSGMLFC